MKLSFCKLQNEICQNMEFKSYFSPDANEESKAKTWKKKSFVPPYANADNKIWI